MGTFKVDFLGIGAQRCGTTWISKCLTEHPEICFSSMKETRFFETKPDKYSQTSTIVRDDLWYRSQFVHCTGGKKKGEFSPQYYLDPEAAVRIKRHSPDVKILVALRNPADRSFSHYLFRKRRSGLKMTFDEVIDEDFDCIVSNSYYYHHLSVFLSYFNPDQVFVFLNEEVKKDPKVFMKDLYRFIGVDTEFVPKSLTEDVNMTRGMQFWLPGFQTFMSKRHRLKEKNYGKFAVFVAKKTGLSKVIAYIHIQNKRKPKRVETELMTEEQRLRLNDLFKNDVYSLEQHLKLDCSVWGSH